MIWVQINSEVSLFLRVTLYAEFLPMKARATCILLIEVLITLSHPSIVHQTIVIMSPTHYKMGNFSLTTCFPFSASQIFWALGTVFEVLLAILVMPTLGWRWLLGLSTIPLFIFAILCFVSMRLWVSYLYIIYNKEATLSPDMSLLLGE